VKASQVRMSDGFVHEYTEWRSIQESMFEPLTHRFEPVGDDIGGFGVNWTVVEAPKPVPSWEGMTRCGQMFHLRHPEIKTTFEGDLVDDAPTCLVCAGRS
jgi:hypothetical protein